MQTFKKKLKFAINCSFNNCINEFCSLNNLKKTQYLLMSYECDFYTAKKTIKTKPNFSMYFFT